MEEDQITQRLRHAGRQPVPGEVRAEHVAGMHAAAPTVEGPKRFGRLAVAAAAFVGFAVGSTGFAMAGALPDQAQQVAHDVLSVVQIDVKDPKGKQGQCVSAIAKDPGRTPQERKAAKEAECPKDKPAHAGRDKVDHPGKAKGRPGHAGEPGGSERPKHDGDVCTGPPPWAGKGGKGVTPEAKQQFADARAGCPDDEGEVEDQGAAAAEEGEAPPVPGEEPASDIEPG